MSTDDATREAARLLASLRSMRADSVPEAEHVLATLEHEPDHDALMGCAAVLEEIDARMPGGTLAGFVQVRLKTLAGMVNALLDGTTPTPPAA
ncbi:hypothetical protein SAMN05421509_10172 [Chromohalobacter canadensis]|uniref:Uncharacterized protein n=1 Tax=Chromohalobacter canadensis TaxID=141389 RepID=A0A285VAH7_9GAMM|nr:hypothetical protein [Chromohalobacter canadensis]SOC51013.1 hypothetical protein SAMN05421509_10172 [Chromohalobacter canadensis]